MRVLVLNSGSSSLKFRLFDIPQSPDHQINQSSNLSTQHSAFSTVLSGSIAGIGRRASLHITGNATGERDIRGYDEAARWIFEQLDLASIQAVGHRIVHGGKGFSQPVRVTDAVIAELEQLNELAPLHNPPGLTVIRASRALLTDQVPMVAVFDTAFHAAMPATGSTYAIPTDLA
ncbi:MAG TPA: hypothetical protein VL329_07345, partial [Nitrospiraceae bacterium]|nr:hypothetical protein [Nitrospiraceae bacterium]